MTDAIARLVSISRGHLDTCVAFAGLGPEVMCTCLPAQRMSLEEIVAEAHVERERLQHAHRVAQEHVHTQPLPVIVDGPPAGSQLAALDELLDQTQPIPRVRRARVLARRIGEAADWVSSTAWLFVQIVPLVAVTDLLINSIASGNDDTPGGYATVGALVLAVAALGVRYGRRWHRRRAERPVDQVRRAPERDTRLSGKDTW